ncbi:MAG: class II glutamine amidotransferase [Actinomycetota bacterium]
MCELLGVSVEPAARLGVYFHQFRPRAEHNREGWGIAWWCDGHAEIRKEAIPAHESALAARLAKEHPASETFIVHVRAATVGELTVANAHPWLATALGREWVFAHNGTLQDLDRLDTGRFVQAGETDSERAFHHVLTRLERLDAPDEQALVSEILAAGRELSQHDSRVNFLLSDGVTLYAYHDGHKTLHVLEKQAADRADLTDVHLDDEDYRLSLALGDAPHERAVVVASVPLTGEAGWERLEAGAFLVIRGGRVVERVRPGATP